MQVTERIAYAARHDARENYYDGTNAEDIAGAAPVRGLHSFQLKDDYGD